VEKSQNKTRENIKNFAVYSHFPPNVLGGLDGFSRRKEETSVKKKLQKLDPSARIDQVPDICKSILMANSDKNVLFANLKNFLPKLSKN